MSDRKAELERKKHRLEQMRKERQEKERARSTRQVWRANLSIWQSIDDSWWIILFFFIASFQNSLLALSRWFFVMKKQLICNGKVCYCKSVNFPLPQPQKLLAWSNKTHNRELWQSNTPIQKVSDCCSLICWNP